MKAGLREFLESSISVRTDASCAEAAMTVLMKGAFDYRIEKKGDGFRFRIPYASKDAFAAACRANSLEFEFVKDHGVRRLLRLYRRRAGLLIGFLAMVVLLAISDNYVWTVKILNNGGVPDKDIMAALDAVGFGPGSKISAVDFDELQNDVLLVSDGIAWITVNMRGTVATVEARAAELGEKEEKVTGANVVAAVDGQVQYIIPYSGRAVVKAGDVVRAGQLLISGVTQSDLSGTRFYAADGVVMAATHRTLTVSVPFERVIPVATGRIYNETRINIFNKIINISLNSGNTDGTYGKINDNLKSISHTDGPVVLFGMIELPITAERETFAEYESQTVTVDTETAIAEAFGKLSRSLAELSESAEILSRTVSASAGDNEVTLVCELDCLEDIAQQKSFIAE